MLFKDAKLKAERGYVDPKSYVRNDGSEVLHGRDWTARKKELWERCNGRCYYCRQEAVDAHHLVKRSEGRDDRLQNLIGLCREHHRQMHPEKEPRWSKRSA